MKFFRLRQSPVENLTFVAMVVALDALLSLLSTVVPFSAVFLMLLAPLTAAMVGLYCRKRYVAVYVFAALGICFAVTAWDFMTTLFYMVPALLVGTAYGLASSLKFPPSIKAFISALLSFGLFYLSLLLIQLLLGVDMVAVLLRLIGREKDAWTTAIFPLFVLGYSYAQTGISHAFLHYELRRLGFEEGKEGLVARLYFAPALFFLTLGFGLGFVHAPTAYVLFGLGIYWSILSVQYFIPKPHPIPLIVLGFGVFSTILLFAATYAQMPGCSGLLLLSLPFALLPLAGLLNRLLTRNWDEA